MKITRNRLILVIKIYLIWNKEKRINEFKKNVFKCQLFTMKTIFSFLFCLFLLNVLVFGYIRFVLLTEKNIDNIKILLSLRLFLDSTHFFSFLFFGQIYVEEESEIFSDSQFFQEILQKNLSIWKIIWKKRLKKITVGQLRRHFGVKNELLNDDSFPFYSFH